MTPSAPPCPHQKTRPRFFWLWPAVLAAAVPAAIVLLWRSHETARELMAKSLMTLAGWLATPFVLESSAAITGLVIVLTYNEWRRRRDGPDWVEMEVDDGAGTKPQARDPQDGGKR